MTTSDSPSIFISGDVQGIGRAVAEKFLAAGWTVGAYDINEDALAKLRAERPEVIVGKLDVTDYQQWGGALADFTSHTGGKLTVLDDNAGTIGDGDITDQPPEIIRVQVDINCTGLTLGTKAAHPYLKHTKGSHLVNMGSAPGIYGQPHIVPYSASKFYVSGLTQALDLEWRKDKIRVVATMPLWVKTKLADVSAGSTRRLDVRITPDQVADATWRVAHPQNFIERQHHFYSVLAADFILHYLGKIDPQFLSHPVNAIITGQQAEQTYAL